MNRRRQARSARSEPQASEVVGPSLRGAFTLFEVLAAVLIFGLVYTVLAEVAIKSVYAEGDTHRRLTASLIADRVLFEHETQLDQGVAPEFGETEVEEDIYRIRTSVTPFDGSVLLPPTEGPNPTGEPAAAAPSLLAANDPSGAAMLFTLAVEVSWTDGLSERSLRRTTYGLDWESAAPLLEDLQPPPAPEQPPEPEEADTQ
jgi:type II secretory pathway pseudopilin PulG